MIKRAAGCQSERRDGTLPSVGRELAAASVFCVRHRVQQYAPVMMEKAHRTHGEDAGGAGRVQLKSQCPQEGEMKEKSSPQQTGVPAVPDLMGSQREVAGTHTGRLASVGSGDCKLSSDCSNFLSTMVIEKVWVTGRVGSRYWGFAESGQQVQPFP